MYRPITRRRRSRLPIMMASCLVAIAVLSWLSLCVGAVLLEPADVVRVLSNPGRDEASILVWSYRLPRTVVAIVVAAALGTAGGLIQAFTRNPLADPGILGINAGAALAATLAVGFFGLTSVTSLIAPALIGAAVSTLAVITLAALGKGPATPLRMTLAGVALAATLGGIGAAIRLGSPQTFDRLRAWAAGSVAGRELADLAIVAPLIIVGLVVAIVVGKPLNALMLGEEAATSLGVNIGVIRITTIATVAALVGSAIAIAGPIGFLGLMVPHACRSIVGNDHVRVLAASVVAAPVVLLVSDITSRLVIPGSEVPVGVVTAFIGAPVLVALVRRKRIGL